MPKVKASEAIKVVVRIRPLSKKEIQDDRQIITNAYEDQGSIEVSNPTSGGMNKTKQFSFDAVFSATSSQRTIFDTCAAPIVQSVLDGYNGTIFAYGQTGAGKTHTMEGDPQDPDARGIIPNAFQHIFDHVALKGSDETYLVRASYFEIYNEEIRDLLSSTPKAGLDLKESADRGVYVKGLTSHIVKSFEEINHIMQMGKKNRSVGATLMNAGSSRSHSVFSIVIECCVKDAKGKDHIRVGRLNCVDLAGSERQGKTGATGERLKEATKINLSLSALGNVISALVDGKTKHVPYRDSKLTRILQDSLGGNTKTVMCANAGPAEYNYDETLSTLRYANRAKNIKNKPIINEDPKDAMLREYKEEIAKLKSELGGMNQPHELPDEKSERKENENEAEEWKRTEVHEQKLREIQEKAEKEKADLLARSGEKMNKLEMEQKQSAEQRKILEEKLEEESRSREAMDQQRRELHQKLQDMEAQLMIGGEIASRATKQEAELRKAQQELIAKREEDLILARKMAEKEEVNFQLEEQYSSLQEACQSITKKLKKLWKKYQQAKDEIEDLHGEFQTERTSMLDTIRDLERQLKLKNLILDNFIPPKYAKKIDDEAEWNEASEEWRIGSMEAVCQKNVAKPIPTSIKGAFMPETDYARQKRLTGDSDPRWRRDNVLELDLHFPDRVTQSLEEDDGAIGDVSHMLKMSMDSDMNDPYLWYSKGKNGSSKSKAGEKRRSIHKK